MPATPAPDIAPLRSSCRPRLSAAASPSLPPRIEIHRAEPGQGHYAIYHGRELVGRRFESQQAGALWAGILRQAVDLVERAGGTVEDRQIAPIVIPGGKADGRAKPLSFAAPDGGHATLQRGYGARGRYSGD
jgi:hypothetical protein